MDLVTLSTVLTFISSGGDTLPKGYQEITTTQATCRQHMAIMQDLAAINGAEAETYCLYSFTSMRPVARPER